MGTTRTYNAPELGWNPGAPAGGSTVARHAVMATAAGMATRNQRAGRHFYVRPPSLRSGEYCGPTCGSQPQATTAAVEKPGSNPHFHTGGPAPQSKHPGTADNGGVVPREDFARKEWSSIESSDVLPPRPLRGTAPTTTKDHDTAGLNWDPGLNLDPGAGTHNIHAPGDPGTKWVVGRSIPETKRDLHHSGADELEWPPGQEKYNREHPHIFAGDRPHYPCLSPATINKRFPLAIQSQLRKRSVMRITVGDGTLSSQRAGIGTQALAKIITTRMSERKGTNDGSPGSREPLAVVTAALRIGTGPGTQKGMSHYWDRPNGTYRTVTEEVTVRGSGLLGGARSMTKQTNTTERIAIELKWRRSDLISGFHHEPGVSGSLVHFL